LKERFPAKGTYCGISKEHCNSAGKQPLFADREIGYLSGHRV
jgi:hypothetical protein